ncbi:metal homeostasis factor Atx1p [Monosporozyma unispora]|nr:Cytosolic copper metallochaperone [Kazachstania unispora]
MPNHYHFDVVMTCSGCSSAIDRVLKRMEPNVSKYNISLENQTVDVETDLPLDTILTKIEKTGKEVKSSSVVDTPLI